jgi:hypothetical protein
MKILRTLGTSVTLLLMIWQPAQVQGQASAGAKSFDAVSDFSIKANPNEVWSYGWSASLGATLKLYSVTDTTSVAGISAWLASGTYPADPPYVAHNDTATEICFLTVCVPPTYLHLHPGSGGQYSLVRWTAPTGGTFAISGAFEGLDFAGPTTTDVHVVVNSRESLLSGPITSYDLPLSFLFTAKLKRGDTVDLAVGLGADGTFVSDSTGVRCTITRTRGDDSPENNASNR